MLTSAMKTIGLDLSIKFKPYGAINLAKGVNGALVVLGFALELWDSWNQHKKQEEFNKAKKKIIDSFEIQKKELIESLDSENFTQNFFPKYIELQEKLKVINLEIENMHKKEQLFNKWVEEGEIINVEVYER